MWAAGALSPHSYHVVNPDLVVAAVGLAVLQALSAKVLMEVPIGVSTCHHAD